MKKRPLTFQRLVVKLHAAVVKEDSCVTRCSPSYLCVSVTVWAHVRMPAWKSLWVHVRRLHTFMDIWVHAFAHACVGVCIDMDGAARGHGCQQAYLCWMCYVWAIQHVCDCVTVGRFLGNSCPVVARKYQATSSLKQRGKTNIVFTLHLLFTPNSQPHTFFTFFVFLFLYASL